MTELAQRVSSTPMAPYIDVMYRMNRREKEIVKLFLSALIEQDDEKSSDVVDSIRRKYGIAESDSTKFFREHAREVQEWDRQAAWERLTDEQRDRASHFNLTAEDMDERTFAIIEKHLK